ncbi:predicted protein [Thalassiosira pseudonana CCMP1335]|uniref:Uncharacterized protein n=1 Tax=Thalassiosira pseudonana TaxID=35128 RepID=B8C1Y9_THAPS|nr:predicted protein [Thalassiosira pseudonana CCMP1335]EED91848.1 predicted protein [Thalassiosira pseudonana CCMP1335]|eukprot:g9301.t1 g9301   contig36:296885-297740(-)
MTHVLLLSALLLQAASNSCVAFHAGGVPSSRATLVKPLAADGNPFNFFKDVLSPSGGDAEVAAPVPAIPDVVVDSDYKLAAAFGAAAVSIVIATDASVGGSIFGGLIALLGSLFAVQATRIRFVFDQDCFELKAVDADTKQLADSGENIVVGGANRWSYDSFVNWDFYPSVDFPILVYFKETQTPKPDGGEPGQIHFFPAIANCKQLEEQFEIRGCARVAKD